MRLQVFPLSFTTSLVRTMYALSRMHDTGIPPFQAGPPQPRFTIHDPDTHVNMAALLVASASANIFSSTAFTSCFAAIAPVLQLAVTTTLTTELIDQIKRSYANDPRTSDLLNVLATAPRNNHDRSPQERFVLHGGLIYLCHSPDEPRIYIPDDFSMQTAILQWYHGSPFTDHPGASTVLLALQKHVYWPKMAKTTRPFVASCDVCQRTKRNNQPTSGPYTALPIPRRPFEMLSVDVVSGFLEVTFAGKLVDSALTFVDHLTHACI